MFEDERGFKDEQRFEDEEKYVDQGPIYRGWFWALITIEGPEQ